MPTLIEATKAKLATHPFCGPASATPIALLIKASDFERCAVAAMSIKCQRADLQKAKELIANGMHDIAKLYIAAFKAERKNYNLLFTLGKK